MSHEGKRSALELQIRELRENQRRIGREIERINQVHKSLIDEWDRLSKLILAKREEIRRFQDTVVA